MQCIFIVENEDHPIAPFSTLNQPQPLLSTLFSLQSSLPFSSSCSFSFSLSPPVHIVKTKPNFKKSFLI